MIIKKNYLQYRVLSLMTALILVFTSLNFSNDNVLTAKADENPSGYNITFGAPKGTSTAFSFPKAKVTGNNGISTAKNLIFSLSTGYIVSTEVKPTITDLDQGGGKHQTVMWYWDEPMSLDYISEIIRGVVFEYTENMSVEIIVDGNSTNLNGASNISFLRHDAAHGVEGGDGEMHYYIYIAKNTTWDAAYDQARSFSCLGLRGYLTTCTCQTEDKVYDKISNSEAWAGGARVLDNIDILDAVEFDNSGVNKNSAPTGVDNSTAWKWICGPEAGMYIPINTSSSDWNNKMIKNTTGGYEAWNSGEPNNSSSKEWALELHFSTSHKWNDYPAYSTTPSGYYVEFSYYDHLINNFSATGNCFIDGYNKTLSATGKCTISSTEEHKWDFETTRSDTITAKCIGASVEGEPHNNCKYKGQEFKLSINAEDKVYDGTPAKEADLEGDFYDVVNFLGYKTTITYEGINKTVYPLKDEDLYNVPTEIGDYKVTVKLENLKNTADEPCYAYDTFCIKKQNTSMIQASVESVECDYDGNEHGIIIDISEPNESECVIRYGLTKDNISLTENPKFKEGVHTVWYEIEADGYMLKSGSASVSINPRKIEGITYESHYTYDGKEHQVIVNYPADKVDKILFSDNENGPFEEVCPSFKDALEKDIFVKIVPKDKEIFEECVEKVEFCIEKLVLQVKEPENLQLVYSGLISSPVIELSGAVGNDKIIAKPIYEKNIDYKNIGKYFVDYELSNPNYSLPSSFKGINYEIVQKRVDIKAKNLYKVVGETDPELEYSVEGLCGNDKFDDITIVREEGENPGDYIISVTLDASKYPNYDINIKNALLTIGDHKKIIDPYKAATCTEDGCTEGCHCEECGKILIPQEVIPALGHDFSGEWIVVKEPTETENGEKIKECKNGCKAIIKEVIPSLKSKPEDDPNAGQVSKISEVTDDSPVEELVLNNTKSDLLKDDKLFNNEDLAAINEGENATIWLSIDAVDNNNQSNKDYEILKKEVNKVAVNNTPVEFFDLKLYKQIGKSEKKLVPETNNDISVSISIPDNLINKDTSINREYFVICCHEGGTYVLQTEYIADSNMLKFLTRKFSLYAIGYKDTKGGLSSYNDNTTSVLLKIKTYTYTGGEIRPKIKVYYSTKANSTKKVKLKENVDYIVEYKDNVNVGTGTIKVKGIGDYSLEITKKFKILEKKIDTLKMGDIPSFVADGTDLTQKITDSVILYEKGVPVDMSNFKIEVIGDSSKAGKVKVIVSINPDGNYRGTKKLVKKVSILSSYKYDLSKAVVSVSSNKALVYNGKAQKPKVSVTIDGKKIPKKEYSVVFSNNINAGTAYVTVTGKHNSYGGSEKIPFEILPADFSSVKIKNIYSSYWHTDMKEINPSVKLGKIYLKKDVDYVCEVPELDINELNDKFAKSKKFEVVITLKSINPNFKSENSTLERKVYIYKRDISKAYKTNIITGSKIVNGEEKPEIIVSYINDSLKEGEDYTVKYNVKTNKKTGITSVKAVVKGCGKYCGKRKISWEL